MFSRNWFRKIISFCLLQACAPPTFIFKGRCYDMCPMRTYSLNKIENTEELRNQELSPPKNLQDDELQSIERKKRTKYLHHNVNELNDYNDNPADIEAENIKMLSCEPCDKSCLRCFGPLSSQCSFCPFGSQLKRIAYTNETYCINFSERSSGNALMEISSGDINVNPIIFILVPSVFIITIVIFFAIYSKGKCLPNITGKQNKNEVKTTYSYDRVALIADEDNQEEEVDLLSSLPTTVQIYTDDKKT